jgi:hypothetical protein
MITEFRPSNHSRKDDAMRLETGKADYRSTRSRILVLGAIALAIVIGLLLFSVADGPKISGTAPEGSATSDPSPAKGAATR